MDHRKPFIFDFLEELKENNHKDWMDQHRHRYLKAKDIWLIEVEKILSMLGKYEPSIPQQYKAKDTISRITNNRQFHPDKPLYKDYFTFSVMEKADCFSPLHISIGATASFLGCGYHQPDKRTLKNIRDAIDFDGLTLQQIIQDPAFRECYGHSLSDDGGLLKTAPQGYDKDHPYVHLLRYKSYVIMKPLSIEEVLADNFVDEVEKAFVIAAPFRHFLKKANSI